MAPVLAVVVQSLPDHLHDLGESHNVVRQIGHLRHDRGRRAPWIVRGGLTYFYLFATTIKNNVNGIYQNVG